MSTVDPDKVYDSSNLQAMNDDFLAARLAEVLPDGPPPAPDVSTRELDDKLTALRDQMTTSSSPALQEELNGLLRQRWPEGSSVDPFTSREAWRPNLPPGHTWDVKLVAGFEDTAPGGQSLMHVAADALRSSSRWRDAGESLASLASRYGDQEAEALLEDALSYAKAHVPDAALADLKRRGILYAPELIRSAALFWRQKTTR